MYCGISVSYVIEIPLLMVMEQKAAILTMNLFYNCTEALKQPARLLA